MDNQYDENETIFDTFQMRLIDSEGVRTFLWHQILREISKSLFLSNFLPFSNGDDIAWTLTKNLLPSHFAPFSNDASITCMQSWSMCIYLFGRESLYKRKYETQIKIIERIQATTSVI